MGVRVAIFTFALWESKKSTSGQTKYIRVAQKTKILNFKKNMKYVSYMIYLRPMIILESLKYLPRLCTINFDFSKGFTTKYKENIGILVFWRFSIFLFLWNGSKSFKSFCLIDMLHLIPILP